VPGALVKKMSETIRSMCDYGEEEALRCSTRRQTRLCLEINGQRVSRQGCRLQRGETEWLAEWVWLAVVTPA
jgi:hypothetical protein